MCFPGLMISSARSLYRFARTFLARRYSSVPCWLLVTSLQRSRENRNFRKSTFLWLSLTPILLYPRPQWWQWRVARRRQHNQKEEGFAEEKKGNHEEDFRLPPHWKERQQPMGFILVMRTTYSHPHSSLSLFMNPKAERGTPVMTRTSGKKETTQPKGRRLRGREKGEPRRRRRRQQPRGFWNCELLPCFLALWNHVYSFGEDLEILWWMYTYSSV